ncbi:UNVERIFIED_CONTAM: hypothetical protein GTU68_038735 [Idotea baltica]|nr:hypothetical protein [Idotea baltica]
MGKVPEINITVAETPSPTEVNPKEKKSQTTQPQVKIEICEATPDTPIEDKFIREIDSEKENSVCSTLGDPSNSNAQVRRKKSLTWIDESSPSASSNEGNHSINSPSTSKEYTGATLGCDISSGERKRRRGSSDSSSRRSSTTSISSGRKNSGSWDPSSRKGSYSSVAAFKQGGYYPDGPPSRKGSHVGEALVLSRRSSLCSEASSRRGSTQGPGASRRGSYRNTKDEAEAESLLRRASETGDVTLSSILNHIAYVNQANASKGGVKVKESRKEQVRQVLIVTYMTAILAMSLSLLLVLGLYSHPPPLAPLSPWLWFSFESLCRLIEFLIGCAMANITRQPVNRPTQYGNTIRLKPRNSIYM